MEQKYIGKYLDIIYVEDSASGRTSIFRVENKDEEILGNIEWYAPWRQYCFTQCGFKDIVLAKSCLEDIIRFIDQLMKSRRNKNLPIPRNNR